MKTTYVLLHKHNDTEVVATFTDARKAAEALDLYARYVIAEYRTALSETGRYGLTRHFDNGHVVTVREVPAFTRLDSFKAMLSLFD